MQRPANYRVRTTVLDDADIPRVLHRMAHEIVERNRGTEGLALIGIRTRGEFLARRLHAIISELASTDVPVGVLDVSFYRDDTRAKLHQPVVKSTDIPFDLNDRKVILVDDVLFTGRSVRAGMDEIMDFGRPAQIQLAVLVDRGHRELPIQPDYTGSSLVTSPNEHVEVRMTECDGEDRVLLLEKTD